jgi:hypothetical protein
MAAHVLHDGQFQRYRPKSPREDYWTTKASLGEVGEEYHRARQGVRHGLIHGYDVGNIKGLTYRGPGEHSYREHQAIMTREHIVTHNEMADVLHHVHGIDVGAPDYMHDPTRQAVRQKMEERGSRGGRKKKRLTESRYGYGPSSTVSWGA